MYDLVRTVAPAARVIAASDLRAHLRLDSSDQDTYLEALIDTAIRSLETDADRSFITQTWRMHLRGWWRGSVELPRGPLQSVTSIAYVDANGDAQTLSSDLYEIVADALVPRIHTASGSALPSLGESPQPVTITYVAGYGNAGTNCPPEVVHSVRLLAAHLFSNAGPVSNMPGSSAVEIPHTLRRLVQNYTARGAT